MKYYNKKILGISILVTSSNAYCSSSSLESFMENSYIGINTSYQIIDDDNTHDKMPDNNSVGFFLGYKLKNNISFDLGYQYWGSIESNNYDLDSDLINMALRYDYFINDNVGFFGRAGAAYVMVDDQKKSENYHSVSPLAEVGMSYRLSTKISLNLSYQYINNVGDSLDMDINSFNLSLVYNLSSKTNEYLSEEDKVSKLEDYNFDIMISKRNIFFEFGRSNLQKKEKNSINVSLDRALNYNQCKFKIIAYTDNIGSENYNEKLSQQRAEAVKQQLILLGINENSITAEGLGESNPIASNDTKQGRAKNRRVELRVFSD